MVYSGTIDSPAQHPGPTSKRSGRIKHSISGPQIGKPDVDDILWSSRTSPVFFTDSTAVTRAFMSRKTEKRKKKGSKEGKDPRTCSRRFPYGLFISYSVQRPPHLTRNLVSGSGFAIRIVEQLCNRDNLISNTRIRNNFCVMLLRHFHAW